MYNSMCYAFRSDTCSSDVSAMPESLCCYKHWEGHIIKLGEIYCRIVDGDRYYEEK